MNNRIKKDLTDEDIDSLFNDNNVDILKDDNSSQDEIIPIELSIQNKNKSDYIERPENQDSDYTKQKKLEIKSNEKILSDIENDIRSIKSLNTLEQAKQYIKKLNQYENKQREKEYTTKSILAGATQVNVDNSTECKFHIYKPRHMMGDIVYCYCKYCSAMKEFTQSEWDDYCVKYRKWF